MHVGTMGWVGRGYLLQLPLTRRGVTGKGEQLEGGGDDLAEGSDEVRVTESK